MACGMLALNIVLIPKWGIVGAAVGAALTNAVTNVWYLAEVRRTLGVLPYSRTLLAFVASGLRKSRRAADGEDNPEGSSTGMDRHLGRNIAGISRLHRHRNGIGLDADDELIARAVWSKMRGVFQGAEGNA